MNKKTDGIYVESKEKSTWCNHHLKCDNCGFYFMLQYDLDNCYCPCCGAYLKKGVKYEQRV